MEKQLIWLVIITAIAGILFISLDTYPAIRIDNVELGKDITENKTEEMLREISWDETKRGMIGDLLADLEKAQLFSSNKETIRAGQVRSKTEH